MPSGNTSNKTLLYSYLSPSGATINVYNDGTEMSHQCACRDDEHHHRQSK